jgi:uncharacterized protein YcbX
MESIIGTITEIWRYPVKSMRGERVETVAIGPQGLLGDRALALREVGSGHLVSAKKWPRMLELRATYASPPGWPLDPAAIVIELPDGPPTAADDPALEGLLSHFLGFEVRLERSPGSGRNEIGIDPATIFGGLAAAEVMPGLAPGTVLPPTFGAPRGTFFDAAPIHLIASATLAHLGRLLGESAPATRRFRPNLLVQSTDESAGFVEDGWIGHALQIGEIEINQLIPTLRCVMTTHAQEELARDLAILRTAARHHQAFIGVTGKIKGRGQIAVGDAIALH